MTHSEALASRYVQAIRATADAILESVELAGPMGQPEGHLYAFMMPLGITLPVFNSLVAGLEQAGRIRRAGHCLYFVGGSR